MKPVSIVIPVYNERGGLAPTVERIAALLAKLPAGSEALFVDDGSRDGSGALLAELLNAQAAPMTALAHHRNRGYGAALKTGIAAARNETIAIADADGTYPLEKIRPMARLMAIENAAMVVGARPAKDQALSRRFAKWFLRRLAQYLSGEKIPDLNSGLRLFRRADALRLQRLLPDGFSFTTTITMALLTEGHRVNFVPIRYKLRVGRSKIRPIRDTSNFLMLICRTALAFHPMKVFGPVGVALIAAGFALLVARFVMDNAAGVATTITLLVAGMQFLALGLLADLINRRG
jgi:glycosyltransferase involved in cell wall biosynthesis